MQEKWGEPDTAQLTIRSMSERHLNAVNTAILEASLKIKSLSTQQKDKLFGTATSPKLSTQLKLPQTLFTPVPTSRLNIPARDEVTDFKLPLTISQATCRSRTSAKTASSRSSLQSERTKALAEAAAAKSKNRQNTIC